jgi:glyoxylase-like metal-dependent hydrolase (beta-lactamase superfamily II)
VKLGRFQVTVIRDGTWRVDGGVVFGQIPRTQWQRLAKPDGRNRIRLGLNCLLIQSPDGNVLVGTGAGRKADESRTDTYALDGGRLAVGLRSLGLKPTDIQHVVLSHLHFDHAGGATKLNRKHEAVPTFPRAKYFVRKESLQDATHPNERSKAAYDAMDFQPLVERKMLVALSEDKEILPGVSARLTGGHCAGHQMVVVNGTSRKLVFVGDLVPTPYHMALPWIAASDQFPEETLARKREVLSQAEKEQWLLVFPNGHDVHAGYLERRGASVVVKQIDLCA